MNQFNEENVNYDVHVQVYMCMGSKDWINLHDVLPHD